MNRRKLIVAGLVSVVGLLSLSISFSLAWYASGASLRVETIEMEMRAERDLKISTSNQLDTFKERLEAGKDGVYEVPTFFPVSSMFSSLWMNEKASTPLFRDSSSTIYTSTGEPVLTDWDKGFYSQELYLLTDDDLYVTISKDKSVFKADHEKNKETAEKYKKNYPNKTVDQITEELDSLINCLRVSVLLPDDDLYSYYIIDPTKNGDTLMGGTLDNLNDGYFDYYKAGDGENYEIIYGETINREKAIFDEPNENDSSIVGERSAFNAKTRKGVHKFNYEKSKQNGFEFKEEGAYTLDEIDNGDSSMLKIPVYRNTPRKIVLSIYLEGWDRDCINTTMAGSFISDISFKIIREFVEN